MPDEFHLWPLYVLTLLWGLNSAGNVLLWGKRIILGLLSLFRLGIPGSINSIERRLMRKAFAKFFYEPHVVPTSLNYLHSILMAMFAAIFGLVLIAASNALLDQSMPLKMATIAISLNVCQGAWHAIRAGMARQYVAVYYTEIGKRYLSRPGWKDRVSLASVSYDTRHIYSSIRVEKGRSNAAGYQLTGWTLKD